MGSSIIEWRGNFVLLPFILCRQNGSMFGSATREREMELRKITVVAGICAAVLGAGLLPTASFAQSIQYDLRRGDVYVRPGYEEPRYERRYERRERNRCSPRAALNEARRWLREPRIVSQDRRNYYIDGYGKSGGGRGQRDAVYIDTDTCDRQ